MTNFKKYILTTIIFIFLFVSFNTCIYSDDIKANDLKGPDIKIVSPLKCQQYIVSRPNILITFKDSSSIDTSSIKFFVNYKNVTKDCFISKNSLTYTPKKKFKKGNQVIKIEICDSLKNKTTLEWYFTVGTPVYNHYYGLLHAHTDASDGHGSFDDAYYVSKHKAKLDYFAITDHSNMLDNNLMCTIDNSKASKEWTDTLSSSNKFCTSNEFIALRGFEFNHPSEDDKAVGHINIFNTDGFIYPSDEDLDLMSFYEYLYSQDSVIGQFNHPGDKFGDFLDFKYSSHGDSVMYLFEVFNGYSKDMTKNINSLDLYQTALDNGWHLAPTSNQDNHTLAFGTANEFRTVLLATTLTKDSVYDSLSNMRVYATQDKNIKIDYFINDLPMGTVMSNTSLLNFYICAIDNDVDDKIKEIQVISNKGKIIKSKKYNSTVAKLEFNLESPKESFYYIKVIQNNNKVSITSPIWIE